MYPSFFPYWRILYPFVNFGKKVVELDWENFVDNEMAENYWRSWA